MSGEVKRKKNYGGKGKGKKDIDHHNGIITSGKTRHFLITLPLI